jgi:hypothetical protein
MRIRLSLLALLFALLAPSAGHAQSSVYLCIYLAGGISNCSQVSATNPLPVSGSFNVTFPTIGSAVPSTGVYNGINVAGTLRGLSGLSTGSLFPAATAIVDASGNQITTFGATATTSNASSGVATSSTNQAAVVWNYGFNGSTWDQLQVDGSKFLKVTNQTAEQAGENHVGEVGGNLLPITNDMTTTNATITTGQSIGGLQTLANAVRVSGSLGASGTSGLIQSVLVSFKDAVATSQIDVFYFNANPTGSTCTNASAFILADADRDKVIGVAHVTDFTAGNTAVVAQAMNQAMPFGLASTTSAFACAVARGSFAITGTANASLVTRVLRN